ncbi:MAG: malate dehydrogenase [Spirulinaceae cyanobacterium SM2_1_0]|nr:malate dehydrogenase [Spirulinaceae cyanobacterium SM2_1_0]
MTVLPLPPYASNTYRVCVIGAGKVGSTLAQRLVERNVADVVLLDVVPGLPQAIALDLLQARGLEGHDRRLIGTNDYADTADCDLIVITAGKPRQPGMSREDLLPINARIVAVAARQAIARSPAALVMLVTNPLDAMVYVAWQATQLAPQRVFGMAGVLDSARLQAFIAHELQVAIADVSTFVLGSHGDLMLPLPRYCTVRGVPLAEFLDTASLDRLTERTRHAGAELVHLYQRGGAYFAPASSACAMVAAIAQNQSRLLPAAAYLDGEYGLHDIFIGVPCRLGRAGIEQIVTLQLTDTEREALHHSAAIVQANVQQALSGLVE